MLKRCWDPPSCPTGKSPVVLNGQTGNDAAEKRRELTGDFHGQESTVEEMAGQCAVVDLEFGWNRPTGLGEGIAATTSMS